MKIWDSVHKYFFQILLSRQQKKFITKRKNVSSKQNYFNLNGKFSNIIVFINCQTKPSFLNCLKLQKINKFYMEQGRSETGSDPAKVIRCLLGIEDPGDSG